MFFNLSPEIISLIESYHVITYWKMQFSKNVLPLINKGWKLVGLNINYTSIKCLVCYTSKICYIHTNSAKVVWMSQEEYSDIIEMLRDREEEMLIRSERQYY